MINIHDPQGQLTERETQIIQATLLTYQAALLASLGSGNVGKWQTSPELREAVVIGVNQFAHTCFPDLEITYTLP